MAKLLHNEVAILTGWVLKDKGLMHSVPDPATHLEMPRICLRDPNLAYSGLLAGISKP